MNKLENMISSKIQTTLDTVVEILEKYKVAKDG
jgi:hypothetical protein